MAPHRRPLTLVAFSATLAIALPAGWHALDADIQTDGPAMRPEQKSLRIGDATVTFDVDRPIIKSGDVVSGVLVASSDRPHDVVVAVTAKEDMGYGGERVPNPPIVVGQRTLTLHARPGGGPPVVASFTLGGRRAHPGVHEWFDLYVTAARDRTEHSRWGDDDAAAVASVVTWGGNSFPITIEKPANLPAVGSFTLAVRVKNTTNQPMEWVHADLGYGFSLEGLSSELLVDRPADARIEDETPNTEGDDNTLAVGAEKLFIFRVSPVDETQRHFTFAALAGTNGGAHAVEIMSFDRPEPPAAADEPASSVAALDRE